MRWYYKKIKIINLVSVSRFDTNNEQLHLERTKTLHFDTNVYFSPTNTAGRQAAKYAAVFFLTATEPLLHSSIPNVSLCCLVFECLPVRIY